MYRFALFSFFSFFLTMSAIAQPSPGDEAAKAASTDAGAAVPKAQKKPTETVAKAPQAQGACQNPLSATRRLAR